MGFETRALYQIQFKKNAGKELAKLARKEQVEIAAILDSLKENPKPLGHKQLNGFEEHPPIFRVYCLCGQHRIIYTIKENLLLVLVLKVGLRAALARWAGADEALVVGLQRKDDATWAVVTRTSADGQQLATAQGALKKPEAIEGLAREVLAVRAPGLPASTRRSSEVPRAAQPPPSEPPESPSGHDFAAGEGGWLLNGAGLGEGKSAVMVEIGWPGVQLDYVHGVAGPFDLGGFAAFDFGNLGFVSAYRTARLGGIARLSIVNRPQFNLGLRLSPGLALYLPDDSSYDSTLFGFIVPLEIVVGLPLASQLSLHFGLNVPLAIFVVPDTGYLISFLANVGLEYKVSAITLMLDGNIGPQTALETSDSRTDLQIRAVLGIGYRF